MAHNLEIRNGTASMFYIGEAPWHGLGTELKKPATAAEAIKEARLDWRVTKEPLHVRKGRRYYVVPNQFAVMREGRRKRGKCQALGVVGSEYTPLQNDEAFAFFDPIVGMKDAAIYHTAGILGNGERVWILAKLPSEIRVGGDDIVDKYLLLSNSHDGTSSVQVKFTPIRVVCENTLTMALARGPTVRVVHTRNVRQRLLEAERLLGIINTHFDRIEAKFQAMAAVQVSGNRLETYLSLVFPDPTDPANNRARARVARDRSWAAHFFEYGEGNRKQHVQGTLWAAYNGVTEYIDHRSARQTEDRRLNAMWFGDGYLVKARAYRVAVDHTTAWRN
jgi:phage/plasmid-like protein (TIGR03299 family)